MQYQMSRLSKESVPIFARTKRTKSQAPASHCRSQFLYGNRWRLHNCDVKQSLTLCNSGIFSGVFCDPPYGLRFMEHAWDTSVPQVETWIEILRVCKPGAHLLAFGSPRTFHRLMVNIEDAGWIIRDSLCWLHSEGFPKSHDIGKEVKKRMPSIDNWDGYGTALKPAWEPVILAMKPKDATFTDNALRHGCGGLNIDGCRIGTSGGTKRSHQAPYSPKADGTDDRSRHWARTGHDVKEIHKGRWPANLLLDEEAARILDQQSGISRSRRSQKRNAQSNVGNGRTLGRFVSRLDTVAGYDDQGGASRFFYCAKASEKERLGNEHPTVKPIRLCEYLAGLILPPEQQSARRLLVPYSGSGSEMLGALMAGWDQVTGIELDSTHCNTAMQRLKVDYPLVRATA